MPLLLKLLSDEKPIVVRKCIQALQGVIEVNPELSDVIRNSVSEIDLSKYKYSMWPLIKKDADALLSKM